MQGKFFKETSSYTYRTFEVEERPAKVLIVAFFFKYKKVFQSLESSHRLIPSFNIVVQCTNRWLLSPISLFLPVLFKQLDPAASEISFYKNLWTLGLFANLLQLSRWIPVFDTVSGSGLFAVGEIVTWNLRWSKFVLVWCFCQQEEAQPGNKHMNVFNSKNATLIDSSKSTPKSWQKYLPHRLVEAMRC